MVVDLQSDIQESIVIGVFNTVRFSAPVRIGSFV
jgi:acyl dehydratase